MGVLINGEGVRARMNDYLDPNGEEEDHESVVVLDSYTIVNPWTVMVESLHALVANGAVAGTGGSNDLALWAKISRIDVSQQFQEGMIGVGHDNTWVLARGIEEGHEYETGRDSTHQQDWGTEVRQSRLDDEEAQQIDSQEEEKKEALSLVISLERHQRHSQEEAFIISLSAQMSLQFRLEALTD